MPPTLRLVLAVLLVLAGAVLVVLALLGATGRLPRNRYAGVRTTASLRTQDAWIVANRIAAAPMGAAAAAGLAGGAALFLARDGLTAWVLAVLSAVGTVVLAGIGGALGARAAELTVAADVVEQQPAPVCGGVCSGCDLVAGCRDATGTTPGTS
ncbi:SdpI family protein [Pseudonocardia phyllosphaerae]|uniref:SdpI family protein n=1 Tax=Pseudonocardia phyllosphaerae TaxID=3390502 RepID=UPI00397A0CDA